MIKHTFQSTLPVWGATVLQSEACWTGVHFNPRSPCGERPWVSQVPNATKDFNPRSPCGERQIREKHDGCQSNFNPRSPCGERRLPPPLRPPARDFNPRSPCGERRNAYGYDYNVDTEFQSTLPVWGATRIRLSCTARVRHFNPRSPCGERPTCSTCWTMTVYFNPRSPCGERRAGTLIGQAGRTISIHAPRVGSDTSK